MLYTWSEENMILIQCHSSKRGNPHRWKNSSWGTEKVQWTDGTDQFTVNTHKASRNTNTTCVSHWFTDFFYSSVYCQFPGLTDHLENEHGQLTSTLLKLFLSALPWFLGSWFYFQPWSLLRIFVVFGFSCVPFIKITSR